MGVNTFKFIGMNNVDDPANVGAPESDKYGRSTTYTEAVSITNMDPDNSGGVKTRKGQTATTVAVPSHSGWNCVHGAFLVSGGFLNLFDGASLTPLWPVDQSLQMHYAVVNNLVVATNTQEYIIIENGAAAAVPAPTTEFKQAVPAGKYPFFYNGRVYLVVDNTLVFTDTNSAEVCDTRLMRIPVTQDLITGAVPVDDGVFIGTETEIFFLAGNDPTTGMELRQVADVGMIPGTAVPAMGDKVASAKMRGSVMLCTTPEGICIGGNGGEFVNVSARTFAPPAASNGAAILREQAGLVYYMVALSQGNPFNTYQQPTFELDEAEL